MTGWRTALTLAALLLTGASAGGMSAAEVAPTRGIIRQNPAPEPPATPPPEPPAPPLTAAPPMPSGIPVRIAALDGRASRFAGLVAQDSPFEIVAPNQQPDLVWDQATREVNAAGDIIARDIDTADLPSVIDRMAMVRGIRLMSAEAPLSLRLLPEGKVHRRGVKVELTVDDVQGRAFYLINVTGDGTVQILYPDSARKDAKIYDKPQFKMEFGVSEPFGSDHIVAVTAPQPMAEFEREIKRLDNRRASGQLVTMLMRYGAIGMRLGAVGHVTAP